MLMHDKQKNPVDVEENLFLNKFWMYWVLFDEDTTRCDGSHAWYGMRNFQL